MIRVGSGCGEICWGSWWGFVAVVTELDLMSLFQLHPLILYRSFRVSSLHLEYLNPCTVYWEKGSPSDQGNRGSTCIKRNAAVKICFSRDKLFSFYTSFNRITCKGTINFKDFFIALFLQYL